MAVAQSNLESFDETKILDRICVHCQQISIAISVMSDSHERWFSR